MKNYREPLVFHYFLIVFSRFHSFFFPLRDLLVELTNEQAIRP